MFRHDYERYQRSKKRLQKRIDKQLAKMNQEIHIRNLFVYPDTPEESFGEYNQLQPVSRLGNQCERLIQHIEMLARIANVYHEKYNCTQNTDGKLEIKEDCKNKITRLLLNEFSLYTQVPLSLDEFANIVNAVHEIAKKQHENVHLLLSTMAVKTSNGAILNMSLYVQCGKNASVTPFSKCMPSNEDKRYTQAYLFANPDHSEYFSVSRHETVSNNTVMQITTAGGAEYVQAVDVCIDHTAKRSQALIEKAILQDIWNDSRLIPDQANHLITSNMVRVSSQITHLWPTQVDPKEQVARHESDGVVTANDIHAATSDIVGVMNISVTRAGIFVENPVFGSNIRIAAAPEEKLGCFVEDLKLACQRRNERVREQAAVIHLGNQELIHNVRFIDVQAKLIDMHIEELRNYILVAYGDEFLQKIFKTEKYKMQLQIRNKILEMIGELRMDTDDDLKFIEKVTDFLTQIKLEIGSITKNIPYPFALKINAVIDVTAGKIHNVLKSIDIKTGPAKNLK